MIWDFKTFDLDSDIDYFCGVSEDKTKYSLNHQVHVNGLNVEFNNSEHRFVVAFAPGLSSFTKILRIKDSDGFYIISKGQMYYFNPSKPNSGIPFLELCDTQGCKFVRDDTRLICWNFTEFTAFEAGKLLWKSDRLSYDGFENIDINDKFIKGDAWSAPEDKFVGFIIDINTGLSSDIT